MPGYKYLPFIEDSILVSAVEKVLFITSDSRDRAEEKLFRNVVDPFSALFDVLTQNIPLSEWFEQEKSRQTQKTMQNAIGEFHQEILGGMDGWEDLGTGEILDICNPSKNFDEVNRLYR